MELGLRDKTALITGASSGLGLAVARMLVQEGARVVICSRSQQRLDAALKLLNASPGPAPSEPRAVSYAADVTDPAALEGLISFTVGAYGGLDLLVTNAGGPPGGDFDSIDVAQWESAVDLTLMSAVRLIKLALPHLKHSAAASVLTITSMSVKQPIDGLLLSNAIRPAVIGLTKSLSRELGPENVRVNSILPGWTATERLNYIFENRARANGSTAKEEKAKVTAGIPLRRLAEPVEFARAAAFLLSPAASYITGEALLVDGGWYAGLM